MLVITLAIRKIIDVSKVFTEQIVFIIDHPMRLGEIQMIISVPTF